MAMCMDRVGRGFSLIETGSNGLALPSLALRADLRQTINLAQYTCFLYLCVYENQYRS